MRWRRVKESLLCPSSAPEGFTVSTTIPAGAEFLGALAERSLPIRNQNVVTFLVGRMTRGQQETLQLLLRPLQSGLLTNHWSVSTLNETGGGLLNNQTAVVTEVVSSEVVRLSIERVGNNDVQITASGPPEAQVVLERTDDLSHWTPVLTNRLISGRTTLLEPLSSPSRSYRGRAP